MGLDLTAASRLTYLRPVEPEEYDLPDDTIALYLADHPDQTDGLADGLYQIEGQKIRVTGGSYHGYNDWRAWLARTFVGVEPEAIWAHPEQYREAPFYPLINFSDAEGFIGPVTSRILAADFARFADQVPTCAPYPWYVARYTDFAAAFTLAADDGAVRFA